MNTETYIIDLGASLDFLRSVLNWTVVAFALTVISIWLTRVVGWAARTIKESRINNAR